MYIVISLRCYSYHYDVKKNTFSSPTSIQPNECYNLSVIFIKISYKYFSVLCIFDSKWVKQRINQLGRNQ